MFNSKEAQIWLREFGAKHVKVDGIAGPVTEAAITDLLAREGLRMHRLGDPLTALTQFVMREVGGLSVGAIDGLLGPITRKSYKHWLNNNWRSNLMKVQDEQAKEPEMKWPRQHDMVKFYGEPGTGLTTLHLPFPVRPSWSLHQKLTKVRCHKLVAPSLFRVQSKLLDVYGYTRIQQLRIDVWGGCVNVRSMRGGKALSTHAFGAAWDTDPVRNALRATDATASLAQPQYKEFWDAWEDEGWLSLGRTRNFDWMHTQAARLNKG